MRWSAHWMMVGWSFFGGFIKTPNKFILLTSSSSTSTVFVFQTNRPTPKRSSIFHQHLCVLYSYTLSRSVSYDDAVYVVVDGYLLLACMADPLLLLSEWQSIDRSPAYLNMYFTSCPVDGYASATKTTAEIKRFLIFPVAIVREFHLIISHSLNYSPVCLVFPCLLSSHNRFSRRFPEVASPVANDSLLFVGGESVTLRLIVYPKHSVRPSTECDSRWIFDRLAAIFYLLFVFKWKKVSMKFSAINQTTVTLTF